MKKARKVPIFLVGLTLVATGVGGNLSVEALSGVPQELLIVAREATEEFSVKVNVIDPYLKINTIEPKAERITGVVSIPEESEWHIKKVVVAYMNFRQGVTEEEADRNLANLTGSKDGNWNIVSLYENSYASVRKSQEIRLNQAQKIMANESDMMYYAVELGTIVEGKWGETQWSRGKINYRSCMHSAVFDRETMSCMRVEDGDKVKYLPRVNANGTLVELPENEEMITWEEEWRDVILADYEAVQDETELMWGYLNDGLMVLDENDLTLDGILKSVEHYSKADSKLLWINQGAEFLKERIAALRKFYEKSEDSDASKMEILEKENVTLKQTNVVLENEKVTLERMNMELENEKVTLEQANAALESKKVALAQERDTLMAASEELRREKGELEQEILRLRAENGALRTEKDNVKETDNKEQEDSEAMSEIKSLMQEIDRMKAEMAENVQNTQDTQETVDVQKCEIVNIITEAKRGDGDGKSLENELMQNDDSEEVKVPNLGGEEVKTNGIWWWLIPVVGLVGTVILLAKRKFARR